ncbi:hypothetical protein FRB91_006970 [Serendipita sp. 411]|nr:hypothetical protein FRC16_007954 [Serendipita sp. 398]KAG8830797.1 hypothetical protein FRC18_007588 [Serendipita sp. 400]KAG8852146.1 hypothetical protein FRB91_006970 [Serendipita sp. 411]KAG8866785.1 hypothetical protein FRC20_007562 [Serendipita sp. 405]
MADTKVDKWLEGTTYGPVMKQTDLYLLGAALTINPILSGDHPDVKISFNVASGEIAATNPKTDEELEWAPFQEQPAVLPRCTTLYILCKQTPWCIHVENRTGVTVKVRTDLGWHHL